MSSLLFEGNIVDVLNRRIFGGRILIRDNRIASIKETGNQYLNYIMPGFVDAHIHIESSMLTPYEFARVALSHGTIATVSDPHEIANVCGLPGIYYMIENSKDALLKFHFGAPSCVPATCFETAGADINSAEVQKLLADPDIYYLSEMMNYPGVLHGDAEVMKKIAAAKAAGKPVDGHAPGLRGDEAEKYIAAGIETDHECFTYEEALEKLHCGMKIIIREGSAAKNFSALHPLISEFPGRVMLCSDDKHPDDLLESHINKLAARAIAEGHSLFDVLQCACINPVLHYRLPVGLLRENDPADFIILDDLKNFHVEKVIVNGSVAFENGRSVLAYKKQQVINHFNCNPKSTENFQVAATGRKIRVIDVMDGQLITGEKIISLNSKDGFVMHDAENDILKIAVVNRYSEAPPAVAFIRNFGLTSGAIASTVAHDSHNIICAGTSDEFICRAVNCLIETKGGLSFCSAGEEIIIPLPIAGLMSDRSCFEIAKAYSSIDQKVKNAGCRLRAPFMTLSFMALLVIPDLKISDKGLFSGKKFDFIDLQIDK